MKPETVAGLIVTLIVLVAIALSYFVTCGLVKLCTLCFGIDYTWAMATGVYFALFLLAMWLKPNDKIKFKK